MTLARYMTFATLSSEGVVSLVEKTMQAQMKAQMEMMMTTLNERVPNPSAKATQSKSREGTKNQPLRYRKYDTEGEDLVDEGEFSSDYSTSVRLTSDIDFSEL